MTNLLFIGQSTRQYRNPPSCRRSCSTKPIPHFKFAAPTYKQPCAWASRADVQLFVWDESLTKIIGLHQSSPKHASSINQKHSSYLVNFHKGTTTRHLLNALLLLLHIAWSALLHHTGKHILVIQLFLLLLLCG